MNQPSARWSASPKQFLAIVAAIVALYFVAGVISRGANLYDLKRQEWQAQNRRGQLLKQSEQMREQLGYMQSDSYVEQAARSMLLWGRAGEKLILPAGDAALVVPTAVPTRRP